MPLVYIGMCVALNKRNIEIPEELKAIAAYLTPIGSTINFVPNDIEASNIVRFRNRYNEYATLQVNDETGNNKDVTFEK